MSDIEDKLIKFHKKSFKVLVLLTLIPGIFIFGLLFVIGMSLYPNDIILLFEFLYLAICPSIIAIGGLKKIDWILWLGVELLLFGGVIIIDLSSVLKYSESTNWLGLIMINFLMISFGVLIGIGIYKERINSTHQATEKEQTEL